MEYFCTQAWEIHPLFTRHLNVEGEGDPLFTEHSEARKARPLRRLDWERRGKVSEYTKYACVPQFPGYTVCRTQPTLAGARGLWTS